MNIVDNIAQIDRLRAQADELALVTRKLEMDQAQRAVLADLVSVLLPGTQTDPTASVLDIRRAIVDAWESTIAAAVATERERIHDSGHSKANAAT